MRFEDKIHSFLQKIYNKSVNGFFIFKSSERLANSYNKNSIDKLIRNESLKAGFWGFITGFGGIFLLPLTLPINIVAVVFIQIRMISAIAKIGKYDLKDEKVAMLVKSCIIGNSIKEILKDMSIKESGVIAKEITNKLSVITITKISSKVEFRLAIDVGKKATFNISKLIPFISGIIGFIIESLASFSVGYVAKDIFILENRDKNTKKRSKFLQLVIVLSINAVAVIVAIILYIFLKKEGIV
jgi:uncharacterized protein (DUF697 family)